MATLTKNTNWENTFTLTKQNNTVLTLSTTGRYVDRNMGLTFNVRSATATLSSTADAAIYTTDGSNAGVNISGAIGSKTTTEPASGYYIAVTASATSTGSVSLSGWINSLTAVTSSGVKYFSVTAATISSEGSVTATPSVTVTNSTNMVTSSTDTGYSYTVGGTASAGTVQTKYKVTRAGYTPTKNATNSGTVPVTPSVSGGTTIYILKGVLSASISSNTAGSASMAATGFTKLASGTSNYYITLTTTAGSVKATAGVGTEGYVKTETTTSSAVNVTVSGNNDKLYIPPATATGSVVDLTAPKVTVSGAATNMATVTTTTSYYFTATGSGTNGSVKGKATVGSTTGMVAASTSHTSAALTITPTIEGSGSRVYIPASTISSAGSVTATPSVAVTHSTTMATTSTNTGYSFTVGGTASASTVLTTYTATAGYTPAKSATNGGTVSVTPSVSGGTTVYILKATGTVTMTKGNGSCSMTSSSNISTTSTNAYNNDVKVTFTGSGSVSASVSATAGYTSATSTFATGASTSSNSANATVYIKGVTLTTPTSGERKFAITVPNGDGMITFVFHVDSNGDVYVDDNITDL